MEKKLMSLKEIKDTLNSLKIDSLRDNISRLGIPKENTIGVPTHEIRKLAKKIKKDNKLAYELWSENIHEYRLLAGLLFENLSRDESYLLMKEVENWALCDHMCKELLIKSEYFRDIISEWKLDPNEYVRRAAFVLISVDGFRNGDKLPKERILKYLSYIKEAFCNEESFYVKKGIFWALRDISKSSEKNRELVVSTVESLIHEGKDISKSFLKELKK